MKLDIFKTLGNVPPFPFNKMITGMLEFGDDRGQGKIVKEATKDKVRVNLIIKNRAGGNAPLIAQKVADRRHKEKQQRLF